MFKDVNFKAIAANTCKDVMIGMAIYAGCEVMIVGTKATYKVVKDRIEKHKKTKEWQSNIHEDENGKITIDVAFKELN